MKHAIRIHEFGGSEVLRYEQIEIGEPGPRQVHVRHTAIGLNMVDTYYRTGLYPTPLPAGLGGEAAGVVLAVGEQVRHLNVGDRVAYAAPPPLDAYSEERLIDAQWPVVLPAGVDDDTAAAMMLKGLTSWYLLKRSYRVQAGDWVLLYAAAGGVGLIAAQWAKLLGVHVIGVVSTEAKRALALAHGCEHVLLADQDIVAGVRELTQGMGVAAVYDSVGRTTFIQSLDCLRKHGVMVSFGNASGPVDPVALSDLTQRGSLYLTRPTLFHFIDERGELEQAADELFELVTTRQLRINVQQRYALRDTAQAHRDLEQRKTTGSTVLLP